MDMFVCFGLSPIACNMEPQFSCRPSLKHARQPFLAECGPSYATALNYLDLQGA